ncbi:MAG: hypothetical protein MPJ08_08585 [Nitrosopumilus sp.]|nr:hypothetical protein [Nitrosopumilus sp.]
MASGLIFEARQCGECGLPYCHDGLMHDMCPHCNHWNARPDAEQGAVMRRCRHAYPDVWTHHEERGTVERHCLLCGHEMFLDTRAYLVMAREISAEAIRAGS